MADGQLGPWANATVTMLPEDARERIALAIYLDDHEQATDWPTTDEVEAANKALQQTPFEPITLTMIKGVYYNLADKIITALRKP